MKRYNSFTILSLFQVPTRPREMRKCNFKGDVIKDLGDIIYKMFALLVALVTLKFTKIGETLFAKQYTPLVVAAVLVFFLLWIFSILIPNHITIETLFPISLMYGLTCAVSFAALTIILPNIAAILNLTLWVIVFFAILYINYQHQNLFVVAPRDEEAAPLGEVAASGSKLEVEARLQKFDLNGSSHDLGSISDPGFDTDGESRVD